MPIRKASAEWKGNLQSGSGNISTETGILENVNYNFISRFEKGTETNPEELLGAAHAACYSMALAHSLSAVGFVVNSIRTQDDVHIDRITDGWEITKIEIHTIGDVSGIDEATFYQHAEKTKLECPVSKALTGPTKILHAELKPLS